MPNFPKWSVLFGNALLPMIYGQKLQVKSRSGRGKKKFYETTGENHGQLQQNRNRTDCSNHENNMAQMKRVRVWNQTLQSRKSSSKQWMTWFQKTMLLEKNHRSMRIHECNKLVKQFGRNQGKVVQKLIIMQLWIKRLKKSGNWDNNSKWRGWCFGNCLWQEVTCIATWPCRMSSN